MVSVLSTFKAATDGTTTDNLVLSAYALSGENRHSTVFTSMTIGGADEPAETLESIVRTGDTYAEQTMVLHSGELQRTWIHKSTTQPTTGSNTLTVTLGSARNGWGVIVVNLTGVDQSARITGTALNTDANQTGGFDNHSISSATDDLVLDIAAWRNTGSNYSTMSPKSGQTAVDSTTSTTGGGRRTSMSISSKPGASTVTMGWDLTATGTGTVGNHILVNHRAVSVVEEVEAILEDPPECSIYVGDSIQRKVSGANGTGPYTAEWEILEGETLIDDDVGLEPGPYQFTVVGDYTVRVRVTDDESETSEWVSVGVEVLAVPGPPPITEPDPPGLAVSVQGPRKVRIELQRPDDGGSEITHYLVSRRTPKDTGDYVQLAPIPLVDELTVFIDTNVGPEVEYQYKSVAVNDIGPSAESDEKEVTTPAIIDAHYHFDVDLHSLTPVTNTGGDVTRVEPGLLGTAGKVRFDFTEDTTQAYLPIPVDLSTSDEFRFRFAADLVFQTTGGRNYRPFQIRRGPTTADVLAIIQHFWDTPGSFEQIRIRMFGDDGNVIDSAVVNITEDGRPDEIEVRVFKSSGAANSDGRIEMYFIGGSYDPTEPVMTITGMNTWYRWKDDQEVWFGFFHTAALTGISPSHFFLDELIIQNFGLTETSSLLLEQQRHWHAMMG